MHALEYSDQTPQRGDVVVLGREGTRRFIQAHHRPARGAGGHSPGPNDDRRTVYDAYGEGASARG